MYGINDHLAVTMDIIYFQTKAEASEYGGPGKADLGTVRTVDFSVGAQWRFTPQSRFVPYLGAGFDVMWNHIDLDDDFKYLTAMPPSAKLETDIAFGVHLNAGADYFIAPNVALNAEIRGLLSTKSDVDLKIYGNTWEVAQYNPSNISGFIGVRFFFP
jgi:outer membrane protein W